MATKLTTSIVNSSRSAKGLKNKSWLFNRGDFTFTKSTNTVTSIAKIGSVVAYTASGCKDFTNAGHDATIFENLCTAFSHKLSFSLTANSAAQRANLDKADDIVAVVQQTDGTLLVYGVDYGLWKTSQSQMANDNNALVAVEFATREGMEEEYSAYFYTGTVTQLDALTA